MLIGNGLLGRKRIMQVSYADEFLKIVIPQEKVGLEVGPLDKPFIKKADNRVFYVDYFDEIQLKNKIKNNKNRSPDKVVELDYVLKGRKLSEVVDRSFDYIFTSHVLEHLPNFLGWLNDASKVLNSGGIIFSIVPDCRYCFDVERPWTGLGELVENYVLDRDRPAPRHAFDQRYYHKNVKAARLWADYSNYRVKVPRTFTVKQSYDTFDRALKGYHDCHVNLFTPDSIVDCIEGARKLGMHDFKILKCSQTRKNKLDFFIALQLD
ncbi:methyltransferase domain-containing protein [Microbulbifer sp. SSSA005]|uniref:methyltransferase domain-containing protein n=1 Tax=Microbulbifer sp. SSSA005 TaxID=3243378 RepID=UPI004039FA06